MLRNIPLKQAYHKPEDNIAKEFYLPCLAAASRYDRAVGFFSSAIYILAWSSLRAFVANGGRMRLICSPVLSEVDASALMEGVSARAQEEQSQRVLQDFRRLLDAPGTTKPARVLAALVALEVVEFRIAWVKGSAGGRSQRLFHDKLGIFRDAEGNVVAFKGSMNETWAGLALDGNLESVDVFSSWSGERENDRVRDELRYFERLWDGSFPGVDVQPLSEVAREELISAADTEHWEEFVEEIERDIEKAERWSPPNPTDNRRPRPHQSQALEAWISQDRRGILKHATGSGKTFTALCAIKDALERGEIPVVLVPSDLLLRQWAEELAAMFSIVGLRLLVCGGGNSKWRSERLLRSWTRPGVDGRPRVVLTTIQTASRSEFISLCVPGQHLFIVADEVHRLGAVEARAILAIDSGPRLGLSATPERAGDTDGTAAIFEYFGDIVPPPFSLSDAIAAGALTPYSYHVHRVTLNDEEQDEWATLTAEVRQLFARMRSTEGTRDTLAARLKRLLIRRARIVKSANAKVTMAIEIVREYYSPGTRWIVYCDDQRQMDEVFAGIQGIVANGVFRYHSAMEGDRSRTLKLFEAAGGIVVSIRCLDEGVDIPSVDTALILASSKNPREYIQRRGRVLRRSAGKLVANIHDVLVIPRFDPDEPPETSILEGELVRAVEFGRSAINPSCVADLERLAIEHGLDFERLRSVGVEDDES